MIITGGVKLQEFKVCVSREDKTWRSGECGLLMEGNAAPSLLVRLRSYSVWRPGASRRLLVRGDVLPSGNNGVRGGKLGIGEPARNLLNEEMNTQVSAGKRKKQNKKKEHRRWSIQLNQLIIPMLVCWARWEFPSPGNKSAPARRWCRCQPGTAPQQGNPWGNHRLRTAFPLAGPGLIRFRWWPPRATGGRW